MRLTPLDIHQKEFRRGIRGYNEEEVDSFLDEVATEFERLFQENIDLKEQVERLQKKLAQYENFEQTLQDTMLAAQKSAEEIQNNARRAAELIIRDAELKAKEIIQEAFTQKQEQQAEINSLKKLANDFKERFHTLLESYASSAEELSREAEKLPVLPQEKAEVPVSVEEKGETEEVPEIIGEMSEEVALEEGIINEESLEESQGEIEEWEGEEELLEEEREEKGENQESMGDKEE